MSGAKGSKMPRGDKHHILNWVIPTFDDNLISSLEATLDVIDEKVAVIQKENIRLALLRDTLLPKLMSGEIAV